MKKNKLRTILAARILRKEMTDAEALLWKYLSNRGMVGIKFRRQHPMDDFVIDFFCASHKLGIELDGGIHIRQREADLMRQKIIEAKGIKILRFKNKEVLNSLDSVLRIIKRTLFPSPRSGAGWPSPDKIGTRTG